MMTQSDLFEGRRRRDAGKALVATSEPEAWRQAVHNLGETYLRRMPSGRDFSAEDVRAYCEEAVPQPHHPNAWSATIGALLKQWKAKGEIQSAGATEAKRPSSHARLLRRYVRS